MAQQVLQAQIVLSGRLDSSFGKLVTGLDSAGNRLLTLASGIQQLSQPIINAGKDITQLYTGFDDTMKYIQAIGGLTEQQLKSMEKAARQAGMDTRYTATQAAEALSYGAEAGLKYAENISLLPTALNMAAAGNMELETAMDQLLTIIYSTGTPIEQAAGLVDQLAAAASESKTDIESMGEAVTRMGGIARYAKGGTKELFTMLGMLAQRGQEGSEAGTYLRNVILSLVTPTEKASDAIAELGLTGEELEEALDDLDTKKAREAIEKLGLSVYDSATGQLRPFLDILMDLDRLTSGLTEKERNDILGSIFPKRTLSAATNLLGEIGVSMERIQQAIDDSTGTAERMAKTRESGLGGALRLLKSAKEELELSFGDVLSEKIIGVSGMVRDLLITLSRIPEGAKGVLVDIAAVIAGMGPAARLAGFGLKGIASLLGFIASPAGAVMTGILAIGALAFSLHQMAESRKYNAIRQHFGQLEVDADVLKRKVQELDGGLTAALEGLGKYGEAAETAAGKYQTLVSTLSGNLLDLVTFGGELTEEQYDALLSIGGEIAGAVQDGITNKKLETLGFLDIIMPEDKPEKEAIKGALDTYFTSTYDALEEISNKFRGKLHAAWEDKTLTVEERQDILDVINEYNKLLAEVMEYENAVELEEIYQRGMRLGFGAFEQTLSEYSERRKYVEEDAYKRQDNLIAQYVAGAKMRNEPQEEIEAYVRMLKADTEAALILSSRASNESNIRFVQSILYDTFPELVEYASAYRVEAARIMRENPGMSIQNVMAEAAVSENLPQVDQSAFTAFIEAWKVFEKTMPDMNVEGAKAYYESMGEKIPQWITDYENLVNLATTIIGSEPRNLIEHAFSSMFGEGEGSYADKLEDMLKENNPIVEDFGKLGSMAGAAFYENVQAQIVRPYYFNGKVYVNGQSVDGDYEVHWDSTKNMAKEPGFALGGRATEPSIFGEAGPEWAIPEAHTARTAELLDKARAASGFTWPELISMSGGLGGNPAAEQNIKIIFAPVIHAADASGVEEKLRESERRFMDNMDDYLFEMGRRKI